MKGLLMNYIKMLKSGFFYKTFLYSLLFIIPSVIKTVFHISNDFYAILFVILVGFTFASLGMNEISEKRYVFCLTLPISTKDIIKIAYLHAYTIYIIGLLGTSLFSIFSHQKLPRLYLFFTLLFLLSINYLYPSLASSELKLRTDQQPYKGIFNILLLFGMIFIALLSLVVINGIGYNAFFPVESLTIVIISFIIAFTLKKSYKITLKRIMEQ